jgi:hypothetical protein
MDVVIATTVKVFVQNLSVDEDRELIAELTEMALAQAAPDELAVFDETAEEYFADPQGAVSTANKGQAVGFGLELAMITPAALAVGSALVQALVAIVSERTLAAGARTVNNQVRRLMRREETDARLRLTVEQAGRLRQTALDKAQALGLPEAQAALLAESFVGALWAAG